MAVKMFAGDIKYPEQCLAETLRVHSLSESLRSSFVTRLD